MVAQQGHIGVGRNLHQRDAGRQHKQRTQEEGVGLQLGRRVEQQAAYANRAQAHGDAALVANPAQQRAGGHGHHEVGGEEAKLDQHGLHIAQREHRLQVRDEDVIQRGDQAPHEKKRGQYRERPGVALGHKSGK